MAQEEDFMANSFDTIVPIILIIIAAIWVYSVFGEHIKRFYEWIKSMGSSGKDRFKAANPAGMVREFTYS